MASEIFEWLHRSIGQLLCVAEISPEVFCFAIVNRYHPRPDCRAFAGHCGKTSFFVNLDLVFQFDLCLNGFPVRATPYGTRREKLSCFSSLISKCRKKPVVNRVDDDDIDDVMLDGIGIGETFSMMTAGDMGDATDGQSGSRRSA